MLPDSIKNILDKGEIKPGDPVSDLKIFISNNPDGDISAEVKRLQGEYKFRNSKRAHLLFDVLFKPNTPPDLAPHKKTFHSLMTDVDSQRGVLECIEKLCSASKELTKKSLSIVKNFYDSEIVEEDVILDWYEKRLSNPDIKRELQRLINWLREAEEESEEEE